MGVEMTNKQRAWLITKAALKWLGIIALAVVLIPAHFLKAVMKENNRRKH